jgi:hypothetical protein
MPCDTGCCVYTGREKDTRESGGERCGKRGLMEKSVRERECQRKAFRRKRDRKQI